MPSKAIAAFQGFRSYDASGSARQISWRFGVLESRLDDLDECRAFADVAVLDGAARRCSDHHAQGTAAHEAVDFPCRRRFPCRSIGRRLLKYAMCRWLRSEVDEAIVTVDMCDRHTADFFGRNAFTRIEASTCATAKTTGTMSCAGRPMQSTALLLSIRPNFASAIYARLKRAEFRRIRPRCACPIRALIYETRPVGLVTGSVTITEIVDAPPSRLAAIVGAQDAMLQDYQAYLSGASQPCALILSEVVRFAASVPLVRVLGEHARPPQSYRYVSVDGLL